MPSVSVPMGFHADIHIFGNHKVQLVICSSFPLFQIHNDSKQLHRVAVPHLHAGFIGSHDITMSVCHESSLMKHAIFSSRYKTGTYLLDLR